MWVGCRVREDRPGLSGVVAGVAGGIVTVARVTYEDQLVRFGVGWLEQLLAVHRATLKVLSSKKLGGREELLEGFVSLVTTFGGHLYGMRSVENRRHLLATSMQCQAGGA